MDFASKKDFERAGKTRDKIEKITSILEKQKVQDINQENKDIINYCIIQNKAYFNLFQIRDGKLIGQENFTLSANDIDEKENQEVLSAFLEQYYKLATDIPKEILLPHTLEDQEEIESFINLQTDKKTKIIIPKIGTKNKLLEMSLNNARIFADRNKPSWKEESDLTIKASKELQKVLGIKDKIKRIECYDISHLSGTDTVGSMIVFENGAPKNEFYRKFKVKTVSNKPDDYKSMAEVLFRRFSKIALTYLHKDYILRKSIKKDKDFIEKNNKVDLKEADREFYILEKNKEQIGFIAVKKHNEKVAELRNVWIKKEERGKKLGYKMIQEIIKKNKLKRAYIICKNKLKEYYLLGGFEEISKIPEELNERYAYCKKKYGKVTCMTYDSNKHKEDPSFKQIPNLVIIDGGKGQLAEATKIFQQFNLKIPYISLAKRIEEIFTPGNPEPILLPRNHEALKLLQRARDEAHRFAIGFNKDLRSKAIKDAYKKLN